MNHQLQTIAATLLALLAFSMPTVAAAQEPTMRLRLKDGSFATGQVVAVESDATLGWQSTGFEQPFLFDVRAIRSVSALSSEQPQAKDANPAVGQGQCFELSDGGMLVGHLGGMDDQWVTVRSELLGEVQIERSRVVSLVDAGYAGELIYSGPNDDKTWKPGPKIGDDENWEFEAGALVAKRQGASIVGEVKLPSKSQISLVLSWKGAPDFVFSFGTGSAGTSLANETIQAAARLEVWDKQLALLREVDTLADIELLAELSPTNPRLELTMYLDQEAGSIIVCDSHGRPLGRMTLPPSGKSVQSAVHIVNHGTSLTLERFEVRAWDGTTTIGGMGSGVVLSESDEPLAAKIVGFDPATNELELLTEAGELQKLPISKIRRGDLGASHTAATKGETRTDNRPLLPPAVAQPPQLGEASTATTAQPPAEQNPAEQTTAQNTADVSTLSSEVTNLFDTSPQAKPTTTADSGEPSVIEVVWTDRTRLKGKWLPGREGKLQFEAIGVAKPVYFEPSFIRGVIGDAERYTVDLTEHKNGTVKIGDSQLAGYLEQTTPADSTSALNWHPHGSRNSSSIRDTASGAIVYRKALPKVTADKKNRQDVIVAPMVQIFLGGNQPADGAEKSEKSTANTKGSAANAKDEREIVFRSGDAVDGIVKAIDESGVKFESSATETKFAAHEQMQSVWLNRQRRELEVSAEKLKRLMTVPRSMKQDPPTHLFVSVLGDFLRGRLVSLNDEKVTIEVRLEMIELPRDQVAQIVWLHDRDWSNDKEKSASAEKPQLAGSDTVDEDTVDGDTVEKEPAANTAQAAAFLVHAIKSSDQGLTFAPVTIQAGVLSGTSDLLGACTIELSALNQLLFGRNIGEQVRAYREDPWTLSLAQSPKAFSEDAEGPGAQVGSNSPLVGEMAPDFGLKTLSGETFRLSKSHERIVVLDFWASWCGPCIQTIPLVEEVVKEIGEDKVHLVAVNIQEAPARVQAAVERLGMNATVLLDRDGEAAAAYAANAIPQTVIIDQDGRVTHVFIGGGPKFVASFRAALENLVATPLKL